MIAEATPEDCFVMSLVENLARRQHRPLDLVREIGALKTRGYLSRLVANPAIEQWLAARHPEILSGFRSIISVASLDAAAADGDDDLAPTDEGDAAKRALWPGPRPEAGPSDQIQS